MLANLTLLALHLCDSFSPSALRQSTVYSYQPLISVSSSSFSRTVASIFAIRGPMTMTRSSFRNVLGSAVRRTSYAYCNLNDPTLVNQFTRISETVVCHCLFLNTGTEIENGGAIYVESESLIVWACEFVQCKARDAGGSIYAGGELTIEDAKFDRCFLFVDGGSNGAALCAETEADVDLMTVSVTPFSAYEGRCQIYVRCPSFSGGNLTYSAASGTGDTFCRVVSEVVWITGVEVFDTMFVTGATSLDLSAPDIEIGLSTFRNISGTPGVAVTITVAKEVAEVAIRNVSFVEVDGGSLRFDGSANLVMEWFCFSHGMKEEITGAEFGEDSFSDGRFNEEICVIGRQLSLMELWTWMHTMVLTVVISLLFVVLLISICCHLWLIEVCKQVQWKSGNSIEGNLLEKFREETETWKKGNAR